MNCEQVEGCNRKAVAINVRTGLMACTLHDEGATPMPVHFEPPPRETRERLAVIRGRLRRADEALAELDLGQDESSLENQVEEILRGLEGWI